MYKAKHAMKRKCPLDVHHTHKVLCLYTKGYGEDYVH